MQNDVILERMDDSFEETRWLRKGDLLFEGFDDTGALWPLFPGKCYRVDLGFEHLDFYEPIVINKTKGRIEQIDNTYAHYLYGYVKNNIFYVGGFKFDFERYNDYEQYDGKFLKFMADRICVEFIQELPGAI